MERFNHLKIKELKVLRAKIEDSILQIKENHNSSKEGMIISKEEQSDQIDAASADYANNQILRMRNREIFYSKKLNSALEKFKNQEYGLCEDCGEEIKFARLNARPTAELCINCKEESEKSENVMFMKKSNSYSEAPDLRN